MKYTLQDIFEEGFLNVRFWSGKTYYKTVFSRQVLWQPHLSFSVFRIGTLLLLNLCSFEVGLYMVMTKSKWKKVITMSVNLRSHLHVFLFCRRYCIQLTKRPIVTLSPTGESAFKTMCMEPCVKWGQRNASKLNKQQNSHRKADTLEPQARHS